MKTFQNPQNSPPIGEFVYAGCRYAGIAPGLTFSILSNGMVTYLLEAFPQLIEAAEAAPIAENAFCCSKCGKDCGSKYMKERHEKSCKAEPKGLATILKPSYIFWNFKDLDKTQLTEDQFLPTNMGYPVPQEVPIMTENEAGEPAPGVKGTEMIGKTMQEVTIDREGVAWFGKGLEDDRT